MRDNYGPLDAFEDSLEGCGGMRLEIECGTEEIAGELWRWARLPSVQRKFYARSLRRAVAFALEAYAGLIK
jgi:hypothetical protein